MGAGAGYTNLSINDYLAVPTAHPEATFAVRGTLNHLVNSTHKRQVRAILNRQGRDSIRLSKRRLKAIQELKADQWAEACQWGPVPHRTHQRTETRGWVLRKRSTTAPACPIMPGRRMLSIPTQPPFRIRNSTVPVPGRTLDRSIPILKCRLAGETRLCVGTMDNGI